MANFIDNVPTAMMQRRNDVRHHLNKLVKLLATDIPKTERTIAQKRYEALEHCGFISNICVCPVSGNGVDADETVEHYNNLAGRDTGRRVRTAEPTAVTSQNSRARSAVRT